MQQYICAPVCAPICGIAIFPSAIIVCRSLNAYTAEYILVCFIFFEMDLYPNDLGISA